MSVSIHLPQVVALKRDVENRSLITPRTHEDFKRLREIIFDSLKESVSETTLERVWSYSNRNIRNVSIYTLNVLSRYAVGSDWEEYCRNLAIRQKSESGIFDINGISADQLQPGDRLIIGWQPDRLCRILYMGDNRFVAEETRNAKLKEGDTFSCLHFQLGQPLCLENLNSADGVISGKRYCAALNHGLSVLQLEKD